MRGAMHVLKHILHKPFLLLIRFQSSKVGGSCPQPQTQLVIREWRSRLCLCSLPVFVRRPQTSPIPGDNSDELEFLRLLRLRGLVYVVNIIQIMNVNECNGKNIFMR